MLNPPSHLRSANIAKRDVPYAWDEWNIKAYYWDIDPAEFTKLDALTNQANLGLPGYEKVTVSKGPGKGIIVRGQGWVSVDKSNYKQYSF